MGVQPVLALKRLAVCSLAALLCGPPALYAKQTPSPKHGGQLEDGNPAHRKDTKKSSKHDRMLHDQERDRTAPINFGFGVNVKPPGGKINWRHADAKTSPTQQTTQFRTSAAPLAAAIPSGPNAATNGTFGPVIPWPIIPIHLGLLPDGRVISYGSDENGAQTGQLNYDLWTPSQGQGVEAHILLSNQTTTDLFCSGFGGMPDGRMLITGGDNTINGARNYANSSVNVFDPTQNALNPAGNMLYARWYSTVVPLPDGTSLLAGGIGYGPNDTQDVLNPITIPELYDPASGLYLFPDADNGGTVEWFYPRLFVSSDSSIYNLDPSGLVSTYSTVGNGSFRTLGTFLDTSTVANPSVMFAPGQVLSVRRPDTITGTTQTHLVDVVDLTGNVPVVGQSNSVPGGGREWANATLLADGQVFVNGGSGEDNTETRVSYDSYIWNPATGTWSLGGTAQNERLYHSTSLLLPDASVLTGGGGAPGPVNQLNAEIYYPPYLYDKDGNPAPRPALVSATALAQAGTPITLTMGAADPISRVTFLRIGAVTHSFNPQQRVFNLPFTQDGTTVTAQLPTNGNDLLPGYYMVFAFGAGGTPSVAQFTQIAP